MAEAVENASVFVLCFSEYYKASPNCRAEAMYAFRLKKNIVPVRVQERYIPDGWLGFLIGTELYYDISDDDYFELNVNKLAREIYCRIRHARRRDSVRHLERKFVAEVQLDHQYVLSEPFAPTATSARARDDPPPPPERSQLGVKKRNIFYQPPSDMSFTGLLARTGAASNKSPAHTNGSSGVQSHPASNGLKAGDSPSPLKPSKPSPPPPPVSSRNFSPSACTYAQTSKWSSLDDSHPHHVPVFSSALSSSGERSNFEVRPPDCTPMPMPAQQSMSRPQQQRLLAAASCTTDAPSPSDRSLAYAGAGNGHSHSSGISSACASAVHSPRPAAAVLPAYYSWSPEQVQQWLLLEQLPELLERCARSHPIRVNPIFCTLRFILLQY